MSDEPEFYGWFRMTGTRWRAVVFGDDEPSTFRRLQEYRAARRVNGDLCVMRRGAHPSDPLGRPLRRPQDERGLFPTATGPTAGADGS